MADFKISSNPTPVPARTDLATARADAVRAAQRAFFDAALEQKAAPAPPPVIAPMAPPPAAPAPDRLRRPGSLLDIKV